MRVQGLTWLGLRTSQFNEMVTFFRDVMGMTPIRDEPGIAGFQMTDGTNLELYDLDEKSHAFFTTGPVVAFRVDNVDLSESDHGSGRYRVYWSHPTHGQIQLESLPRSRRYIVRDFEQDRRQKPDIGLK